MRKIFKWKWNGISWKCNGGSRLSSSSIKFERTSLMPHCKFSTGIEWKKKLFFLKWNLRFCFFLFRGIILNSFFSWFLVRLRFDYVDHVFCDIIHSPHSLIFCRVQASNCWHNATKSMIYLERPFRSTTQEKTPVRWISLLGIQFIKYVYIYIVRIYGDLNDRQRLTKFPYQFNWNSTSWEKSIYLLLRNEISISQIRTISGFGHNSSRRRPLAKNVCLTSGGWW